VTTAFQLALAQMSVQPGDVVANQSTAERLVARAAAAGADLVILPELWATGYDESCVRRHAASLEGDLGDHMAGLARAHGVHLLGSLPSLEDGRIYNTAVLFGPTGQAVATYRKTRLFGPLDGPMHFVPGDALPTFELPWGRAALAVCYDLRFPEVFRAYAAAGATLLLLCAQWPRSRIAHWDVLLRARAIENQCVVAACNAVGEALDNPLGGHSAAYGPDGKALTIADETETVALARVDMEIVTQARAAFPFLEDAGLVDW
jgi:predicted amidohydrolase